MRFINSPRSHHLRRFLVTAQEQETYGQDDPDCWWTRTKCDKPKDDRIKPDIIDVPEPLSYGIGFDDGPNCSHNVFYDTLSEQKIKATMFYIGSNVMNWPIQAKRGLDDGHQLSVHTWSHGYLTSMTNEEIFAELYYTQQAIKLVTGVAPLTFRPPYGDIDNRVRAIAQGLNMTAILWQYDSQDWKIGTGNPPITAEQIDANYQNVIDLAGQGKFDQRGTIMLQHEINNYTMTEALKWLPKLQSTFKHLIPVASAWNMTQPYEETNVTYPNFAQMTGAAPADEGNSSSSAVASSASSAASTGGAATAGGGGAATKSASPSGSASGGATKSGGADNDKAASEKGSGGAAMPGFSTNSALMGLMGTLVGSAMVLL